MAKTETAAAEPTDILQKARSDYDRGHTKERDNIRLAYEDLAFLAGDQWLKADLDRRQGRPTLMMNELPQFVHQITGDIRQMKPSIKVVPVDSGADEKVADLRAGLIRYIENRSDASAIYFRAADSQVSCGIGHWRVETEYSDQTFNQEIRIAPIEDGVSVIWDPDAVQPAKEDATFCFVPVDMSRKAFEKKYPEVTPESWDDAKEWTHLADWLTDDYVRVAEYWYKETTKKLVALGVDGAITDVSDATPEELTAHKAKGARIEPRDSIKICRYLITAGAVLEGPTDWPGPDIPIVPVVGEETRIGRNLIRNGIVRNAKDPQRMLNYFHSAHAETVALQPKAPFLVTETNIAKYQGVWEKANDDNLPYLPYIPDQQNGGAAPQRVQPPVSSSGVLDGLAMSKLAIREVIGIYDAGLGAKSNETSGKAILARQREGDVGSYLYIDNFSRGVRRTGQIINNLIPFIYDTERTIRIMGEDGKIDVLEINKASGIDPNSGETIFTHDMTTGSYDVVATMGPSYTTKREEAKEGMTAFLQAAPEAGGLILDLVAKAQDWPMSEDIAKRLRATLPPKIIQLEAMEKQGATPEQVDQFLAQQQQPLPDPKLVKVEQDGEIAQAKLQAEQQQAFAEIQSKQDELMTMLQKTIIDSQTRVEVAQISAGVGLHKNIVDASIAHDQMGQDAQASANEAQTAANDAQSVDHETAHKRRMNDLEYRLKRGQLAKQNKENPGTDDEALPPDVVDDQGVNLNQQRHEQAMQGQAQLAQGLAEMGQSFQAGMNALAQAISAPKKVIRDTNSQIVGVVSNGPTLQ